MVNTRRNHVDEFFSLSNKEKLQNLIVTTRLPSNPQQETINRHNPLITFERSVAKAIQSQPSAVVSETVQKSLQISNAPQSTANRTETFYTETLGISLDSSSIQDATFINTRKDSDTTSSKVPTPQPPSSLDHPKTIPIITDPPLPTSEEDKVAETSAIIEEVNRSIADVYEVADNVEKLALTTHQTLTGNTNATFSELRQVIEGLAGIRLESTPETPKTAAHEEDQNKLQSERGATKYTGTRRKSTTPDPRD